MRKAGSSVGASGSIMSSVDGKRKGSIPVLQDRMKALTLDALPLLEYLNSRCAYESDDVLNRAS